MSAKVTVVDYGAGNLLNVVRALEHLGANVLVTTKSSDIALAERLVLPGVGTFGDCMQSLEQLNLVDALTAYMKADRLFLGICVGMQVMFSVGEEFGQHRGLGIIPGRVVKIPAVGTGGTPHKIPHTGWGMLTRPAHLASWQGTGLSPLEQGVGEASAYFVHSYMGVPENERDRIANVDYDGINICAAVARGNVQGCQFHPEKSGPLGLSILRSFLKLPA